MSYAVGALRQQISRCNEISRRLATSPGRRLTRRVPADVADVLLGDALLQQPHAHAVLPAEALFTLPKTQECLVTGLLTSKKDKSPCFQLAVVVSCCLPEFNSYSTPWCKCRQRMNFIFQRVGYFTKSLLLQLLKCALIDYLNHVTHTQTKLLLSFTSH